MSDLYDTDAMTWSEHQAALLRRVAAGERINDQVDWENVIEEIEAVGRNDLHAVTPWLMQALRHDLKAEAWPLSREVPHWRAEARGFRAQARRRFTESMRSRIDVADLYRVALAGVPETIDEVAPLPVPEVCPLTLDELLADHPADG
jgi:hypothetical protein